MHGCRRRMSGWSSAGVGAWLQGVGAFPGWRAGKAVVMMAGFPGVGAAAEMETGDTLARRRGGGSGGRLGMGLRRRAASTR